MRSLSRLLRATRVLVEEPLQMPLTDLTLPPREEPPEEQGPTADELRQQVLNPVNSDHRIRWDSATQSGLIRPPNPVRSGHLVRMVSV